MAGIYHEGRFLFTVCQPGAEPALKQEFLREFPDLRPAYARPGLVTWKSLALPVSPDVVLRTVFARAYGLSLGQAADTAAILTLARSAWAGEERLRLHAWARAVPYPEPPDALAARVAAGLEVRAALLPQLAEEGLPVLGEERAEEGDLVLDVIVAVGEPFLVGAHRHGANHSPFAGGRIPIEVPPEAPSRAFAKLEEGLLWSGLPVRAGDLAVEIGSAPGGASYALLRRGIHVVGIDPGAMSPLVLEYQGPGGARFRFLNLSVGALRREQLPARVDWLLLDVNLAPQVALHSVARLVPLVCSSLLGVLFTLKLNEWKMAAEIPAFLARLEGLGLIDVRATQLPANRQEICVAALTRLGAVRESGRGRSDAPRLRRRGAHP